MRKALVVLVSATTLGGLVCATPAAAIGGDATEEQEQANLHPNQPEQAPEAAVHGVPEGKVYFAQAPAYYPQAPAYYAQAPAGAYVQAPPPPPGAIEPPSGAFLQTLVTMVGAPFTALVTPYQELLGQPAP